TKSRTTKSANDGIDILRNANQSKKDAASNDGGNGIVLDYGACKVVSDTANPDGVGLAEIPGPTTLSKSRASGNVSTGIAVAAGDGHAISGNFALMNGNGGLNNPPALYGCAAEHVAVPLLRGMQV